LKNYYKILDVPTGATTEEIKKSFRALALRYHPDKAPDNPFAADHFTAIQEAYEVLSHSGKRARYDEERWLRGLSTRSNAAVNITPQWILNEVIRLRKHMDKIDTYHMNHEALRDYIKALLSPEHLSILQSAPEFHQTIVEEIILSVKHLRIVYLKGVALQLFLVAGHNTDISSLIINWLKKRNGEARWDRYRAAIIIFFALVICAVIFWLK
jgi:curved DNA-binding protein CbpA